MTNYENARFKLTNTQLNKLKSIAKTFKIKSFLMSYY